MSDQGRQRDRISRWGERTLRGLSVFALAAGLLFLFRVPLLRAAAYF